MLRIGENEKQVFVTASATNDGWGNLIAWNPVEIFDFNSNNPNETVKQLDDFIVRQQLLGRRVAGFETYDFGCSLHEVKIKKTSEKSFPDYLAYSFENWISFDDSKATVHYSDISFKNKVENILSRSSRILGNDLYSSPLQPIQSRQWYESSYKKIKNYIKSGDVYQVNLTHPLSGKTQMSGRDLFASLHLESKVDFQSYIEVDGFEIISFSPERFIQVNENMIKTSPIKGTRERGYNLDLDEELRYDLENNPKDMAELNMITDLLRNDLGKICKVGSVQVVEKRTLREYPTLWHAHSTITGILVDNISPISALSSMMPGGSITGCPKKRAIEIIDELEPANRGLYTGSIFVVDEKGNLDSSIAIRTMIKNINNLLLSVGGGVVNDSNEADEYQESLDKAKSFIDVTSNITSSDVLESQFGPIKIEILYQVDSTRVIATKTIYSEKVLELSLVEFIKSGVDTYPEIHKEILLGKSIGKAFKDSGIEFYRNTHHEYKSILYDKIQNIFTSDRPSNVVDVTINVGPNRIPYARILETYSPDVIWASKISQLTDIDTEKIKKLDELIR